MYRWRAELQKRLWKLLLGNRFIHRPTIESVSFPFVFYFRSFVFLNKYPHLSIYWNSSFEPVYAFIMIHDAFHGVSSFSHENLCWNLSIVKSSDNPGRYNFRIMSEVVIRVDRLSFFTLSRVQTDRNFRFPRFLSATLHLSRLVSRTSKEKAKALVERKRLICRGSGSKET